MWSNFWCMFALNFAKIGLSKASPVLLRLVSPFWSHFQDDTIVRFLVIFRKMIRRKKFCGEDALFLLLLGIQGFYEEIFSALIVESRKIFGKTPPVGLIVTAAFECVRVFFLQLMTIYRVLKRIIVVLTQLRSKDQRFRDNVVSLCGSMIANSGSCWQIFDEISNVQSNAQN